MQITIFFGTVRCTLSSSTELTYSTVSPTILTMAKQNESGEKYCEVIYANIKVNGIRVKFTEDKEQKETKEKKIHVEYVEPMTEPIPVPLRKDASRRKERWIVNVLETDEAKENRRKSAVEKGARKNISSENDTLHTARLRFDVLQEFGETIDFPRMIFIKWYKEMYRTEDLSDIPTITTQKELDIVFHTWYKTIERRDMVPKCWITDLIAWEWRNWDLKEKIEIERELKAKQEKEKARQERRDNLTNVILKKYRAKREERQKRSLKFEDQTIRQICEHQERVEKTRKRISDLEKIMDHQETKNVDDGRSERYLRFCERKRRELDEGKRKKEAQQRAKTNTQITPFTYVCSGCGKQHDPWFCKVKI